MLAGRKIKPLKNNKSHLTNDQKEIRTNAEKSASDTFKKLQSTPPKHLNNVARYEYKRVSQELDEMPVRNLDRAILESYCVWYSIFREVSQKLKEEGALLKNDNGEYNENPLVKTLEKATKNIKSAAVELGLTVDSRLRIYIPKSDEKPQTIFDKFG